MRSTVRFSSARFTLIVPTIAVFLLVHAHSIAAADDGKAEWSQFRGPNRDGISAETGLLKKWPKGGPKLVATLGSLGQGYSSLAFSGDYAFTLGLKENSTHLVKIRVSGEPAVEWSVKVGAAEGGGGYAGPRCTPTVDGELVYTVTDAGDICCSSTSDGATVWKKNFKTDFGGKMMSGWGYSESPLIDGDLCIVTPGGDNAMLAALDKTNGEVVWQSKMPPPTGDVKGSAGAGYASVVISNAADTKQYVTTVGWGCIGVRASDGKHLWTYNRVANGVANIPTPICYGNFVFCSTGYGTGSALLELKKSGDGVNAKEVYFLDGNKLQNHHGGLIKQGDHLYGGHGHNLGLPFCLELKTGKVVWGTNKRGPGSESATVICANGQLYFRYQDGKIALIDAKPNGYKLVSTFDLPETLGPSWSLPAISNGKLYFREQDKLFVYDIAAKPAK